MQPHAVVVGLVVVALAALVAAYLSLKLWARHRERIVRLEKGLDPDAPAQSTRVDSPQGAGTRKVGSS